MKIFKALEVDEAKEHAMAGGQALHLHRIIVDRKKAPRCFVQAVDKGEFIAHLFDQDGMRLIKTAKRLGVKVIVVEHPGTPRQHIDLCGGPFARRNPCARRKHEMAYRSRLFPIARGTSHAGLPVDVFLRRIGTRWSVMVRWNGKGAPSSIETFSDPCQAAMFVIRMADKK